MTQWLTAKPIAHRGLHEAGNGAPENSLAAFEAACQAGYPIELDVQITADGEAVVFHDYELERLTGSAGRAADEILADLAARRLAGTKETIPSLRQALDLIRGRVPVIAELKNPGRRSGRLERAVHAQLDRYEGLFAVSSFNPISLAWFARRAPQIHRGQNVTHFSLSNHHYPWPVRTALKHMAFNPISKPHFVVFDHRALPNRAASRARRRGLPLLAYTIRDSDDEARAKIQADNYIFEDIRP